MTQTERILQHLRAGNSLTPLEALQWFGCLRLAARILNVEFSGAEPLAGGASAGTQGSASPSCED